MELVLFRHGPAGDKADWARSGRPDAARPLTREGRGKTREAARGLAAFWGEAELVATSPWTRARQTAEIAAKALGAPPPLECPALVPGHGPEALAAWLGGRREGRIVLVGHEPHLSGAAAWLLGGGALELKKAGALLLALETARAGGARLSWSLPPRALRALG